MQLLTIDSMPIMLNDISQSFVLVDFWATWCIPCINGMNALEHYQKDNPNLKILMICRDGDFKKFKNFVENSSFDLDFYFCGNSKLVEAAYNIQSLPHKVLIGANRLIYMNHLIQMEDLESYKAFWVN